jgi:hypothetical protein
MYLPAGNGSTLTIDDTTDTGLYLIDDTVAEAVNSLALSMMITVTPGTGSPYPRPTGPGSPPRRRFPERTDLFPTGLSVPAPRQHRRINLPLRQNHRGRLEHRLDRRQRRRERRTNRRHPGLRCNSRPNRLAPLRRHRRLTNRTIRTLRSHRNNLRRRRRLNHIQRSRPPRPSRGGLRRLRRPQRRLNARQQRGINARKPSPKTPP